MNIEELNENEIWDLCAMTSECFNEKAKPPTKEKFYRHYQNSKCKHFIMKSEGKIVSSITIFEVNLRVGEKIYIVGGIGDVVTEKSNRCKHYSSQLLDYCFKYMKEQHYALGMLHASIVKYQKHYENFGYKNMRLCNYNLTYDNLNMLKNDMNDLKGRFEEISIDDYKDQLMKMHIENRKFYKLTMDYENNGYYDKWLKSELTEMNEKRESKIFSYREGDIIKGSIAMMVNKESESEIEVMIKLLLLNNESKSKDELKGILLGLLYENSVKLGILNSKKVTYKVPEILCKMCGISKEEEEEENGKMNYRVEEEFDDCWMYKILDDGMSNEDIEIINDNRENVIFRIDNF